MSIVGPLRYRASPCLRCGAMPRIWQDLHPGFLVHVWWFVCGCGLKNFNGWKSREMAVELWNDRNEAIGGDLVL